MYSMFDLLFDAPSYRPIYVISDCEMKGLQKTKYLNDLDEIIDQKKRLEKAYKAQIKHLSDREKDLKGKLKDLNNFDKK